MAKLTDSPLPAGIGSIRGGARLGAGRKPAGYEKPVEVREYEESRARKEGALADLHELDYLVKSGQYLPRAAFSEAAATLLAMLSQTFRSMPDNLERRFNLSPVQAGEIEAVITDTLATVAADLAKMTQGGES